MIGIVTVGGGIATGCGDDQRTIVDAPTDGVPDTMPPDGDIDGGIDGGNVCSPGLAGWYRFEDTSGPVLDTCGQRNGRAEGAGLHRGVAGRIGAAISFDGTDGRVVVPAARVLDFVTAATIEYWIMIGDKLNVGAIVSRGTGDADDNVLQTTDCGNHVTIYTRVNVGASVIGSECDALSDAAWVHVAVVNDGTEGRLYINAELAKTAPGGFLGPLPHDLYIGRRQQGMFPLTGSLDELMWWTVVRSPEQICGDAGGTWTSPRCTL